MRKIVLGALSSVLLLAALPTHANVVFNVNATVDNGHTVNSVIPGDIVTIDIRLSDDSPADYINAVGGAVMGYNPSVLQFLDGQSADTSLFCTNAACTNGLISVLDSTTPLAENVSGSIGPFVQFVSAVSIIGRNGDGARDPGINGVVGGGDAEFRLRFVVASPGATTLNIGTTTDGGLGNVVVLATNSAGANSRSVQGINAQILAGGMDVPEPTTAVLLGLGLAGIAADGKRRTHSLPRA